MTPTFSSDAAEGLVFKPSAGTKVHTADLVAGHAKVQVDAVKDNWLSFPLEMPPNDEVLTLGAARGTYIQWPKCDIVIKVKARQLSRPSAQAPPPPPPIQAPPPHYDPSTLGVDDAPALPVVRARSSPTVSQHKRGRGRGRQAPARLPVSRKLDLGKKPAYSDTAIVPVSTTTKVPAKFVLGRPLVDDLSLKSFGPACQDLHGWYMTTSNSSRQNKEDCVMGSHGCEPFMSRSNIFVVGFNDLWDLFHLDKLDMSLVKSYAL